MIKKDQVIANSRSNIAKIIKMAIQRSLDLHTMQTPEQIVEDAESKIYQEVLLLIEAEKAAYTGDVEEAVQLKNAIETLANFWNNRDRTTITGKDNQVSISERSIRSKGDNSI